MNRFQGKFTTAGILNTENRHTSSIWNDLLLKKHEEWKQQHAKKEEPPNPVKDMLKKQAAIKKSFASQKEVKFPNKPINFDEARKEMLKKQAAIKKSLAAQKEVRFKRGAVAQTVGPPAPTKGQQLSNMGKVYFNKAMGAVGHPDDAADLAKKTWNTPLAKAAVLAPIAAWGLARRDNSKLKKLIGGIAAFHAIKNLKNTYDNKNLSQKGKLVPTTP